MGLVLEDNVKPHQFARSGTAHVWQSLRSFAQATSAILASRSKNNTAGSGCALRHGFSEGTCKYHRGGVQRESRYRRSQPIIPASVRQTLGYLRLVHPVRRCFFYPIDLALGSTSPRIIVNHFQFNRSFHFHQQLVFQFKTITIF